jgi:hypothetical protein
MRWLQSDRTAAAIAAQKGAVAELQAKANELVRKVKLSNDRSERQDQLVHELERKAEVRHR